MASAAPALDHVETKPRLVFFHSSVSGACRRAEGFLAQVLQRRRNHVSFDNSRHRVARIFNGLVSGQHGSPEPGSGNQLDGNLRDNAQRPFRTDKELHELVTGRALRELAAQPQDQEHKANLASVNNNLGILYRATERPALAADAYQRRTDWHLQVPAVKVSV